MSSSRPLHSRRFILAVGLVSLLVVLVRLAPSTRYLKGSLMDSRVLELCDSNIAGSPPWDHVLSVSEMRLCIRNMILAFSRQHLYFYDLDDDGTIGKPDLRILIQSIRSFLAAECGNSVIETVEECDDGNQENTDACSNTCKNPFCGNRIRENTEECDDGNGVDVDDCSSACKSPVCGNGIREGYTLEPYEQCDDGNEINTDSCTNSCREPECGDGYKQATEACDDGNTVDFDSCSNTCIVAACNSTKLFAYNLYPPPSPNAMVLGLDGTLWVAGGRRNEISKISSTGSVTIFPVKGYQPFGSAMDSITVAPDGNLWVTDQNSNDGQTNLIRRVSPTGVVSEFTIKNAASSNDITVGPDGNLWLTLRGHNGGEIVKMSTAGALLGRYPLPSGFSSYPTSIVSGPDNNLWFTDPGTNKIGKMTTTGGLLAEYTRPVDKVGGIMDITKGLDNNLWFTEQNHNTIVKMSVSGQVLAEFKLAAGSQPYSIISGPNGKIWFTEYGGSKIGRITKEGAVSEYRGLYDSPVPSIATGKDGMLYFTIAGSGIGKFFVCAQ